MQELFDGYKESPEINVYREHKGDDENKVYVKNSVKIIPMDLTVDWIYQYTSDGKIVSLSPYLQRILLTKVWRANEYAKSKSYIRDLWKGLGQSSAFFLTPIDLVLLNINEALENTENEDVEIQIQEVKNAVEEHMSDGALLVNLDGQTRSNEAIVPYLRSEFTLNSNIPTIGLNKDDKFEDISGKLFNELDSVQRGFFLQLGLSVNLLLEGDLDDITNALISINSNEKWTSWQEIYHGSFKSPIAARIFEVIENSETGTVRDFLTHRVVNEGSYRAEYSGWEQFVSEHLYFFKHQSWSKSADLWLILKGYAPSPEKNIAKKVKKYLLEIIDNYSSEDNKPRHQELSNYLIFRLVLDNWNATNSAFFSHFNIPKLAILSDTNFVTWYFKKIKDLKTKKIGGKLNTKSYHIVDGIIEAKPDTFPRHCDGGYKLKSIIGRVGILITELNEDLESLITDRIVSETVTMASKSEVLSNSGYKSLGGKRINPIKKSSDKYERGHVQADGLGGTREVTNLVPEVKKSNRGRGKRNIIKMESTND